MAYAAQKATAKRLIAQGGGTVTIKRYTPPSAADASQPTVLGAATAASYKVKAIVTTKRQTNGGDVGANSLKAPTVLLIAATAIKITPNAATDKVVVGSAEYSIRAVTTVAPDASAILYKLEMDQWPM